MICRMRTEVDPIRAQMIDQELKEVPGRSGKGDEVKVENLKGEDS